MARITFPTPDTMSAAQKQAYDAIVSGRRGRAPAPFLAWLHSPELAHRAQQLGEFVRYQTSLPPRLSELAILVVARWWNSEYEWAIHKDEALKGGVPQHVIEAIAGGQEPRFETAHERAVYDFATSLCQTRAVPEGVYRLAIAALGETGVVELVGIIGYYTFISMTLNAFEIAAPRSS